MVVCSSCGAENREGARFCDSCGAPLAEAAAQRELRKVVTVLFCDVTGSTALGERIDPESLRRVMARYFETAKAIVERHGGTVEKFIGDAVMAVFGVPAVHEDDALRAVRAADELHAGLVELNEELDRGYGTRLELRIGVNTGEVVTGTEERLATGDAVNVAARLEQAAGPGEILIGEETHRLVREAIEAEPTEPLRVKGKAEPLAAYRLLSMHDEAPQRRLDAPMVGRTRQLELLRGAFAAVAAERSCHLFTILGTAGVGKSRLAEEFLGTLEGVTVVRGRCFSYGEGISYWPVTEVVKQLAPDEDESAPLAAILGSTTASTSPDEIAWSFRKLLESRASDPLVVVFDDVHWGEPAFLDLVEHVADLSRGAPILLLCMARPELLDRRSSWGGGKLNATNVLLEPLAPGEARALIDALRGELPEALRDRILDAADGNPLFVEEMVVMATADGGEAVVPPTIQALLAARLDQLEPEERNVLERGAIEGLVFHRGAVAALAPDEPQVDGRLVTLVRKDLVRPEEAVLAGDDAYRFRHLLIRDTAYDALPKAVRAELHERFADWLAEHGARLVELDEMLGYHLEQANRYRVELGPADDAAAALAERAAVHLLAGAAHAQDRDDVAAAVALLSRALQLLPPGDARVPAAEIDLATALLAQGDLERAATVLARAEAAARTAGDAALEARCAVVGIELRIQADQTVTMGDALREAERALETLERAGDGEGVVDALRLIGAVTYFNGNCEAAQGYLARALDRAELARPSVVTKAVIWLLLAALAGPMPRQETLRLCEEVQTRFSSKHVQAWAQMVAGAARSFLGEVGVGLEEIAAGRNLLRDLGDRISWAGSAAFACEIELWAGNLERAYRIACEAGDFLSTISETGYYTSVAAERARAALELGRHDEALEYTEKSIATAAPDDFEPRASSELVRARVLAQRGDLAGAEELLRVAAARIEPTDYVSMHLVLALARAEIARLAGRPAEERETLERALEIAQAKGNLLAVGRIERQLAEV
jgi:class 3 adenylate cyclase/tetratricopeptide (TPR) repeat protein